MAPGERQPGVDPRAGKRTAKDGDGALAVDHGSHAEFFVNVAGFAEAADLVGAFAAGQRSFAEKLLRTQHGAGNSTEAAHKGASRPFQVECHGKSPFL